MSRDQRCRSAATAESISAIPQPLGPARNPQPPGKKVHRIDRASVECGRRTRRPLGGATVFPCRVIMTLSSQACTLSSFLLRCFRISTAPSFCDHGLSIRIIVAMASLPDPTVRFRRRSLNPAASRKPRPQQASAGSRSSPPARGYLPAA